MKKYAKYAHGYEIGQHNVIGWLWEVLEEFTEEEK